MAFFFFLLNYWRAMPASSGCFELVALALRAPHAAHVARDPQPPETVAPSARLEHHQVQLSACGRKNTPSYGFSLPPSLSSRSNPKF